MEKICKNCDFWVSNVKIGSSEWVPKGRELLGGCLCKKFIYGAEGERPFPEDSLVYDDYESYDASFETGPLFGCIHFMARS